MQLYIVIILHKLDNIVINKTVEKFYPHDFFVRCLAIFNDFSFEVHY